MQVLDTAGVLFPRWYPPFPPITDPPSHLPPGQPQFPHNQSALPLLCFPPLCFIFIFFRFLCSWFASFLFPASPRWVDNRVTNTRQLEQLEVPKTNEMLGGGLLCLTVKIFRKLNWARVFVFFVGYTKLELEEDVKRSSGLIVSSGEPVLARKMQSEASISSITSFFTNKGELQRRNIMGGCHCATCNPYI